MDLGNTTKNQLEIVLLEKDGFIFSRVKKNNYKISFVMENSNIILSKIIDFNLIKLIYDLNGDVYEKVSMESLNENEIVATLLMRPLFQDLGLPQRFSYIHIKRTVEEKRIVFQGQSIRSHHPAGIPEDAELMAMDDLTCVCDIMTDHKIKFSFIILFDTTMNFPSFAEKMVGIILNKIFKRVKQFIENVRL
jgi:hypothetical protein